MMIPGIMAQRRAAGGAPVLWTPLNMTTVPQIYLDAHDSVVTDVSGFASAISNLGSMGSDGNFSQATAGNRPAILAAELNGKQVLRFDGANDFMVGGSSAQKNLYRNVNSMWNVFVYKKRSTDVTPVTRVLSYHTVGNANAPRFALYCGFGTSGDANKPAISTRRLDSDSSIAFRAAVARSLDYVICIGHVNTVSRFGHIYVNGNTADTSVVTTESGNTSDTTSQETVGLGAFYEGVGGFSDVDIAAVIMGNTALTMEDRQKIEGWAAHKYGLTANLPSGHPYKTVAPTV